MVSMRVLALFDDVFEAKWKPGDLKFAQPYYHERETEINITNENGVKERIYTTKVYDIDLKFANAPAVDEVFIHMKNCVHLYTVELFPPTPSFSMKEIKVTRH